jgi:uncharacterized protein YciI
LERTRRRQALFSAPTLVILAADDLEAAKALAASDPYAKAGLFASVDIRPWNWVIKNPEAA